MARITLAEKLKRRNDFQDIFNKISKAPNPTKFVMDSMNVTYGTAIRLLHDLNIKFNKNADYALDFPKKFVDGLDFKFNEAKLKDLINFKEMIKKYPYDLLCDIFTLIFNKKPTTTLDFELINAICYHVQCKYYKIVYKTELPLRVQQRYEESLKRCLN